MTRSTMHPAQRQAIEVIEALGFGTIERLQIRGGLPCFDPEQRITQSLKFDSDADFVSVNSGANLTLKKEFVLLFERLSRLGDGVVDIEVRHGIPFRLVLERRLEAFL